MGRKLILRALTTKDSIEIDVNPDQKLESSKDILQFAIKVLSRSICEIDGIKNENTEEMSNFLLNQEPVVVFQILESYYKILETNGEQLKN